jgi:hypothetical protein
MRREDPRHMIIALRSIHVGGSAYILVNKSKWTANRHKRENS